MLRFAGCRGLRPGWRIWTRGRRTERVPGAQPSPPRPRPQPPGSGPGTLSAAGLAFLPAARLFPQDEKEQRDPEDDIVLLIKQAKLSAMRGKLEDADHLLHQALKLAHQSHNNQAITYTYVQMANLAFLRGDLHNAEKLFKAAMSQLLGSGTRQDDNAVIEMSLKLCSIYASTERHGLAVEGYKWCIETLEEKVQSQKAVPEESLSAAEKENTRLLLGMSLDSCARYMMSRKQLELAESLYEKALAISQQVQGETHPQTVVLMNDLATVLDMKGHHERAYDYVRRASNLARDTSHPDECVILYNLARVLMHRGNYSEAKQVYEEALKQAEAKADKPVIERIREGMEELEVKTLQFRVLGETNH
ncbi:tetratricopeptide repeat protein 19, mitochondrial [Carcharodon carcharias]|uniref:tetratricopeptide repeat protein 19, mitochondrial n=1 Tax=Carcharodon carcharias TaxID=13397 RepID=UPI001B7EE59B|nr:tetratricopeptide repeat protein 19, mitochondrial [Carcharodon carcharias]